MTTVSKIPRRQLLRKFKDLENSLVSVRCRSSNGASCPVPHATNIEIQHVEDARSFKEIPGPKPLPIVGNLFRFLPYIGEYGTGAMLDQLRSLRRQFGEVVKLEGIFGRRRCVFLFEAEDIEKMYRQEGPWPSRIAMETMKRYREVNPQVFDGYLGLVASQGKMWHDFRSNVNQHMMQPRAIKPYVSRVDQVSTEFVEKMRRLRDAKTSKLPPTFNNQMNKWALESICVIALDHRMGCLEDNLAEGSNPQKMINAVHDMFDLFYKLEIVPSLWKYYDTPNLKKLFRTLDTITGVARMYIDEAKERFEKSETKGSDHERSLLENLLEIDEQTAYIMALDMLTAGIDTTSNASGALLYYIASNHQTQDKLREEVLRVLPEKDSPVTYEVLNRIPYLKACIKETLRLSPIAIGNLRTMVKDTVLGGYHIPCGTDVIACHAVLAQDEKYFPEPSKFIAERWLRENKNAPSAKEAHPFAYMPFGFGPRTCIGRRFAELEIETLALKVLRNFRLEWTGGPLRTKDRFINTVDSPLEFKLTDL